MAEIHVQARKQHVNPSWMWAWIIIGLLVIAVVVYFVFMNKDNNQNNPQEIKNNRNTPQPGAVVPQQFSDKTYVMRSVA